MSSTIEHQQEQNVLISQENQKPLNEIKTPSPTTAGETQKMFPTNEFLFTPLETLLVNKKMPAGYKLELDEVLKKENEEKAKPVTHKKHKKGFNFSADYPKRPKKESVANNDRESSLLLNNNSSNRSNNNNSINPIGEKKSFRQHKPLIKEDLGYIDKDVIKSKSNPLRAAVSKQCERALSKLRKNPAADYFYFAKGNSPLCLSQIEKNIRNYKYKSIYEFVMDLRRIWNYSFMTYPNDQDVYLKTCEMSRYSEEIYKETEVLFEDKSEFKEINKKIDSLEKDIRDIKGNQTLPQVQYLPKKNIERTNVERAMTDSEKATLRNNIALLRGEQMKGIVNIVADTMDLANKKYLELDIDTLSNKKLRELDHYVKNCLRRDKRHQAKAAPHHNEISAIQKLKNELGDKNSNKEVTSNTMSNKAKQSNVMPSMPTNNKENKVTNDKMEEDSSSDSESSSLSSL